MEENGRLVSFIFDSSKVVLEKTEEKTYRFVRGYELISADSEEARTYYHYCNDELGSVTHVVDGVCKFDDEKNTSDQKEDQDRYVSTTVQEGRQKDVSGVVRIRNFYKYDAFGNTVASEETVHNRFRFTGEQYDSIVSIT